MRHVARESPARVAGPAAARPSNCVFRTAAGTVSAARGAYYAHPQNRFWSALHAIGLTPRLLRPEEYPELLHWGLGLTDIAKHVSGMDRELPAGALVAQRLHRARGEDHGQRGWLAFTSSTAGRRYLVRAAGFGEQPERIGQTRLWLLPSPSPTAGWNWDRNKHWWQALADEAGATATPLMDRMQPQREFRASKSK